MIQKRVSEILRISLLDTQNQHGIQKENNLYVRHAGNILHMIEIQSSQWNDRERKRFTMNCGIYVSGVTSIFMNAPEPARPKLKDCCIDVRIGMLRVPRRDIWWEISGSDEPEKDAQIALEIATIITTSVIPFFDRFRSELQVAEFLSTAPSEADKFVDPRADGYRFSYAALIWRKLGDEEKYSTCIEQARQSSKKTPIETFIEAFSIRCKTSTRA